jgi:hypothetical protein
VSPPKKIRRQSRRGAATCPERRWTRATCRGHPRRHLPALQKCHHRDGRKRPHAIRTWARARDQQLTLPERTRGRSALTWLLAGQAPPSRREPRPAKLTPRRPEERPAPVRQLFDGSDHPDSDSCRGVGRGRGRRTRRRRRACHRRWISAPPRGACSHYLSGAAEPRMFMFPSSLAGAKDQPHSLQRPEDQPRAVGGAYSRR